MTCTHGPGSKSTSGLYTIQLQTPHVYLGMATLHSLLGPFRDGEPVVTSSHREHSTLVLTLTRGSNPFNTLVNDHTKTATVLMPWFHPSGRSTWLHLLMHSTALSDLTSRLTLRRWYPAPPFGDNRLLTLSHHQPSLPWQGILSTSNSNSLNDFRRPTPY